MASKNAKKPYNFFLLKTLLLCILGRATACYPACSGPPVGGGTGGTPTNPGIGGGGGGGGIVTTPVRCPRDALKLGVCANLLGGLVGVVVGQPPVLPCCTLLSGLVDLEAAVCLCTAIRANVLGIILNVPVSLTLLLNVCGRSYPPGFICG